MIVLDTDHMSVLQHESSDAATALRKRIEDSAEAVFTTDVSIEEQCRSWLGLINRYADVRQQVKYYERFIKTLRFFEGWRLLRFDAVAADEFNRLRKERVRIGTVDLKIASVVLVNDATLISANLRDFNKVPGLRVADWLHD